MLHGARMFHGLSPCEFNTSYSNWILSYSSFSHCGVAVSNCKYDVCECQCPFHSQNDYSGKTKLSIVFCHSMGHGHKWAHKHISSNLKFRPPPENIPQIISLCTEMHTMECLVLGSLTTLLC